MSCSAQRRDKKRKTGGRRRCEKGGGSTEVERERPKKTLQTTEWRKKKRLAQDKGVCEREIERGNVCERV